MGTRVWAFIEFGPWDEEALKATEPGRNLLDAIAMECFETKETHEDDGIVTLYACDPEKNYGTGQFEERKFDVLASEAGLWWAWGTEGGPTWEATHTIGAPDGRRWSFLGEYGRALFGQDDLKGVKAEVGNDPAAVLAKVEEWMALGARSLAEWIAAEKATAE